MIKTNSYSLMRKARYDFDEIIICQLFQSRFSRKRHFMNKEHMFMILC